MLIFYVCFHSRHCSLRPAMPYDRRNGRPAHNRPKSVGNPSAFGPPNALCSLAKFLLLLRTLKVIISFFKLILVHQRCSRSCRAVMGFCSTTSLAAALRHDPHRFSLSGSARPFAIKRRNNAIHAAVDAGRVNL